MGRSPSSVREFELPFCNPMGLTRRRSRVRRVGPHLELGHRRPPRHGPNQIVSLRWMSLGTPDLNWPYGILIFSFRLADLTDFDLSLQGLDPTLFPDLPSSIQVHGGFANEHAK
jgi:hypothetical protein